MSLPSCYVACCCAAWQSIYSLLCRRHAKAAALLCCKFKHVDVPLTAVITRQCWCELIGPLEIWLEHKTMPHMLWFSPTRVLDMKHSWSLHRQTKTSNIWKAVQNARKCKPASISSDLSSTSQSPSRRTGYTMNCGCFISEYTVANSSCIGLKAPSLLHTSHI